MYGSISVRRVVLTLTHNRTYERQPLIMSARTVAINPAAIVGTVNVNLDVVW